MGLREKKKGLSQEGRMVHRFGSNHINRFGSNKFPSGEMAAGSEYTELQGIKFYFHTYNNK